jgi:hypothetical protein
MPKSAKVITKRAYFTDGQRKYAVPMKGDLEISEYEGGAIFRFKTMAMASMRLRRSPRCAGLELSAWILS